MAVDPGQVSEYERYSPQLHAEQLGAFAVVTVLTAVGYVFWDRVLVPQKRLELSKSKRSGDVKALLDDIEGSQADERGLERWFFADWLQQRRGTQAKKAAIPLLARNKFNSGDNPVIGAVALIMLAGVASTTLREGGRVLGHVLSSTG